MSIASGVPTDRRQLRAAGGAAGGHVVLRVGADPRIAIEVGPADRWIAEHYPTDRFEELPDGRYRAVLAVGGGAWLERLLLRLGPEAKGARPPRRRGRRSPRCRAARLEALTEPMAQSIIGLYRS